MKQYLMLCDEKSVEILKAVFRSEALQFLEVQGMVKQGNAYNALLTPIIPPVNPMPIPEVTAAQEGNTQDVPQSQPED